MENNFSGDWDAASYFEQLTAKNKLARQNGFCFVRVDALEGFGQALSLMQKTTAFVCLSEISQGTIDIHNTPRTRRIKTLFLAMRHPVDNASAREKCFDVMRELFRQFMSHLLRERTLLEQNHIYLDPRISFREIDKYFFSGCACAYFQIAVDNQTSLMYDDAEWATD